MTTMRCDFAQFCVAGIALIGCANAQSANTRSDSRQ